MHPADPTSLQQSLLHGWRPSRRASIQLDGSALANIPEQLPRHPREAKPDENNDDDGAFSAGITRQQILKARHALITSGSTNNIQPTHLSPLTAVRAFASQNDVHTAGSSKSSSKDSSTRDLLSNTGVTRFWALCGDETGVLGSQCRSSHHHPPCSRSLPISLGTQT